MRIKENVNQVFKVMMDQPLVVFVGALIAMVVSAVTFGLITLVMFTGLALVFIKAKKGEIPTFNDLFAYLGKVWPLVGLWLLMVLGIGAGLIVLIIPGILIMTLWIYAPFYLAFKDAGVMDSLKMSSRTVMAKGFVPHILMVLVLLLINLLGGQLIIGSIITFPLTVGFLVYLFQDYTETEAPEKTEV
ncbi:MAG: hypothetical protein ACLFP1_01085 [Candidatus Goldiibacteriota bacterium]